MHDYTQIVGIMVFAIAATAAFVRGGRQWISVGLVNALLCVEVVMNWRYAIRDAVVAVLQQENAYRGRAPWQVAMLVVLAIVGAILFIWLQRRFHGRLRVAVLATAAMIVLFTIMLISLHGVDRLLYAPAGPIMRVAWLWVAGAAAVVWASRRR